MNQLYYGDNLHVMRDRARFPDACVDLVDLDPPFNSKRDYNLLVKSPKGQRGEAQITAFKDSWHWGDQAERELDTSFLPRTGRNHFAQDVSPGFLLIPRNRASEGRHPR